MKSTQAMRDRLRELSSMPLRDDYDCAVICVIDDLEELLRTEQPMKPAEKCIVCLGLKHVWLPLHQPLVLCMEEGLLDNRPTRRQYPCPECSATWTEK
jgi:hypothetical protein